MTRRVIALGVGILIIVLLLLGVKGCLNARKERGFENYTSDLSSIATQSNQLSSEFFARLESPPKNADELSLEAQISSDRGTAEALLQRVENLDTPDELSGAQTELTEAFELRRDALAGVADDIDIALGDDGRSEAINRISGDMRAFLASDVLHARAKAQIESVLADQDVSGKVPDSVFLPEPVDRWLDHLQLTTILSSFAGDAGATQGVHGLALLSTTIGNTTLTADADNSVALGKDRPEVDVEVQNQGDQEEHEVTASYSFSGGAVPLEGEGSTKTLDAQGTDTITLALQDTPETGTPLTLQIEVLPVPGEEISDNNAATYTVTFH